MSAIDDPLSDIDARSKQNEDSNINAAAKRLAEEARQFARRPQRQLKDITEEFTAASNELASGQLIKDDYFTLFEAVGALEIMDPKMDSGVELPEDSSTPPFDFTRMLRVPELIYIIDELICLEIAWLEGYPLSQTLFTSVHIDRILDPNNHSPHPFVPSMQDDSKKQTTNHWTNQILHAYCIAVIRCANMFLTMVGSQNFYEEEDFITHIFGREFLPDLDKDQPLNGLDDALQLIATQKDALPYQKALSSRVTARRICLSSIFGDINGWNILGKTIEGSFGDTHDLAEALPSAFTERVQRHLATSTPPRPKLVTSWDDSRKSWMKLCQDVAEAPRLTTFWIRQSPALLQRALTSFAWRNPSPFPRAVMQDIMFVDGKIADDVSHLDLLLNDLRELVLPGDQLTDVDSFSIEVVSDPRHKCARLMESFIDGVVDEYLNLYRILCQNRPRIRRGLTQLITVFHSLETQAAQHDSNILSLLPRKQLDTALGRKVKLNPLLSWTRYYKLKAMAESVSMGFETDIYLPDELATMYWYLSRLTNERLKLLHHIEAFTNDRAKSLVGRQDRNMRQLSECVSSMNWYSALGAEMQATINISDALWSLYSVLLHLQVIKAPSRAKATAALLYEARLKHYLVVDHHPSPPSLEEFSSCHKLNKPVSEALQEIMTSVKAGKSHLAALKTMSSEEARYVCSEDEWKAEIKQLETTCVAISVATLQLKRSVDDGEDPSTLNSKRSLVMPPPDKRYHKWWIVPQLIENK